MQGKFRRAWLDPIPDGWIKADLHLHSAEDPLDEIDYRAVELLELAHSLRFKALAITLHSHVLTQPEVFEEARRLGILLFPAAEMRLEDADVVILNLSEEEARGLKTFADLRALRAARGSSLLSFSPHPFFKLGGSIGPRIRKHLDCFDAVEYSHFHTSWLNMNRDAVRVAKQAGKPLLATSDTHNLSLFGDHYSLIRASAEPTMEEVFTSIRAGRIRQVSPPWPSLKFARHMFAAVVVSRFQKFMRRLR